MARKVKNKNIQGNNQWISQDGTDFSALVKSQLLELENSGATEEKLENIKKQFKTIIAKNEDEKILEHILKTTSNTLEKINHDGYNQMANDLDNIEKSIESNTTKSTHERNLLSNAAKKTLSELESETNTDKEQVHDDPRRTLFSKYLSKDPVDKLLNDDKTIKQKNNSLNLSTTNYAKRDSNLSNKLNTEHTINKNSNNKYHNIIPILYEYQLHGRFTAPPFGMDMYPTAFAGHEKLYDEYNHQLYHTSNDNGIPVQTIFMPYIEELSKQGIVNPNFLPENLKELYNKYKTMEKNPIEHNSSLANIISKLSELEIIDSPKDFFDEFHIPEEQRAQITEIIKNNKKISMQDATKNAINQGTTNSEVSTADKQEQYSKEQSNIRKNEGGPIYE